LNYFRRVYADTRKEQEEEQEQEERSMRAGDENGDKGRKGTRDRRMLQLTTAPPVVPLAMVPILSST
jgi:hypothetical protein